MLNCLIIATCGAVFSLVAGFLLWGIAWCLAGILESYRKEGRE